MSCIRLHIRKKNQPHSKSESTSRFRWMLHSLSGGRPPLQPPHLPLLVGGVLRHCAEASRSGAVFPPPPGPQGASVPGQHLRRRGQRCQAALRTAGPGRRILQGLFFNVPQNLQDARCSRAVCGCKAGVPRCRDQVRKRFYLLKRVKWIL